MAYCDAKTGDILWKNAYHNGLWNYLLSPLDAISWASIHETGTGSALEALIAYRMRRNRPSTVPADATVRFFYDREAHWEAHHISLGTFMELARAARELVTSARPLDARDLASPEADTAKNVDTDELNQRARHIVGFFKNSRTHLANSINEAQAEDFNLDGLRNDLFRFFFAGINEAVPLSGKDDEPSAKEILLEQAQNVAAEADRRIVALDELEGSIHRPTASVDEKIEVDTKRIKIIFGEDFPVLPKFTLNNAEELLDTFRESHSLQNQDPLAAMTWLGQVAHVRDGCDRLQTSLDYAEALYPDFNMDYTVGQLPYQAGDRWVALPHEAERPIMEARTALMAMFPNGLKLDAPVSGLMVDEWVETIPNPQELAAAAFHFDAPQSRAPHSILLAVPPDDRENWELATLEAIVQETLDLAKLRTLDNAALFKSDTYGHFLPALYFAFNLDSHPDVPQDTTMVTTVSTDFSLASNNVSEEVFPSLNTISPDFGYLYESTQITITGDNLAEATSMVFKKPDGSSELIADNIEIISNSEIRCNFTPQGTYGEMNFEVVTEDNGSALSQDFDLNFDFKGKPPQITGTDTDPDRVYNGETITLTITGNHLRDATAVRFLSSGLQASIVGTPTMTQLKCSVTINSGISGGSKQFEVVTPHGTDRDTISVRERPTLTGISLPDRFYKVF